MRSQALRDAASALKPRALIAHDIVSTTSDLETRVAVALAKALVGPLSDAQREAHGAFGEAQALKDAALACDAMSVRALAAANAGDLELATELSRRASMMSRTESLREQETLANLVLARVRRLTGKPFLATRILSAVLRFASSAWLPWIRWELVMASGADTSSHEPHAEDDPSASLMRLFEHARAGDRVGFDRAVRAVSERCAGLVGHAADLTSVRLALDPEALDESTSSPLSRWRSGIDGVVPFGLLGLTSSPGDEESVLVLVRPGSAPLRLLSPGAPLAEIAGAERLPSMQRKQGRTDTALAVVALAGVEGLRDEDLFRASYGFEFSHNVHAGVFDVLLHRARAHLGEAGDIVRAGGHVTLSVRKPLLLTDPRQGAHEDDRVLQLVARRGRLTAKDTSQELGIPLRSAQAALEALLSSGACSRERNGRSIEYRVDDTTFQEPTDVGG